MLEAMITTLTLYRQLEQQEDDLFEDLELPQRPFTDRGYEDLYLTGWDLDKDTLVDNLLLETAELNVLYTDPDFMKFAIGRWSAKELPVWQALYESMFFKYNPIWNKDGSLRHSTTETRNLLRGLTRSGTSGTTETRDLAHGITKSGTTSGTLTEGGSDTRNTDRDETIERDETSTRSISESYDRDLEEETTPAIVTTVQTAYGSTETADTSVSAYDASTYQNRDKVVTSKTGTDTVTTSPTGREHKLTDDTYTKTTGDNLTAHSDDTETNTDETVTTTYGHTQTTSGTDSGTESGTDTGTVTTSGTDSGTESGTDTGTVTTVTEDLEQGNIGVTMTQELIERERQLMQFNIYNFIIDSFKQRFCLLVY